MTKRRIQIRALIVGVLGVAFIIVWHACRSWPSSEFRLRPLAPEARKAGEPRFASDGFLDSQVSFGPIKGSTFMLPVESVQRASASFRDTIVLDDPGVLERFPTREKRIRRP